MVGAGGRGGEGGRTGGEGEARRAAEDGAAALCHVGVALLGDFVSAGQAMGSSLLRPARGF